jgi:flagellar hook-associated protein FlgK
MGAPAPILAQALEGLSRAENRIEKTASHLAHLPSNLVPHHDEVNLSEEMVNLILAARSYEANLKSIETASELEQHLIDLLG